VTKCDFTSHPSCLLLLPSKTIADGNASVPNSSALYVVACVARYSSINNDMDILKQESLLEVGVDVDDPLL
jgi:hypothetical protein